MQAVLLQTFIQAYNVARESWLTYRRVRPPQAYLDRLNQDLADLTAAMDFSLIKAEAPV